MLITWKELMQLARITSTAAQPLSQAFFLLFDTKFAQILIRTETALQMVYTTRIS